MCQEFRWIITLASISGLIQSIVWMGLGIAGALLYLCVIPVRPYETEGDFFRVTFVKLYFEGPKCMPDGSYLGKFNEEYRSMINLFTPDRVFGVMIAYVILNAVYFILSIMFYKRRNSPSKRGVALGWSSLSLSLSALDAGFCCTMIFDILSLREYLEGKDAKLGEIPYIPLTLALLSSRFIAGWLWNFTIGAIIFLDALCCRNIIQKPPKGPKASTHEKKVGNGKEPSEEQQKSKEAPKPDVSIINGYYNGQDSHFQEFPKYRMSIEATTKFNVPRNSSPITETEDWNRGYPAKESHWHPEPHSSKEWKMTNEGYVSDEERKWPDFEHDLKNFERGQRKIKIVKPPLGKPVSIPVPPPLPPNTSCNC